MVITFNWHCSENVKSTFYAIASSFCHKIYCQGFIMNKKLISTSKGIIFHQLDGQSILDASIDAAYPIKHSCRSGRCGFCKVKLLSGETLAYRSEELTPSELNDNWILSCCRTALSSIEIEVDDLSKVGIPKTVTIPCSINTLNLVTEQILIVTLQLPLIVRLDYLAGQHIKLTTPQGDERNYFLAKAQVHKQTIELHIRYIEQDNISNYWFDKAKLNDLLTLEGPKGTFFLRRDICQKSLYFLATNTGISAVNAMLESIIYLPKNEQPHSITIIWGASKPECFYLDLPLRFKGELNNINTIHTLSHHCNTWSGVYGHVEDVLLNLNPNLANARVYACGSPLMINAAQKLLIKHGLNKEHFLAEPLFTKISNP